MAVVVTFETYDHRRTTCFHRFAVATVAYHLVRCPLTWWTLVNVAVAAAAAGVVGEAQVLVPQPWN